jgi:hypothetical protein
MKKVAINFSGTVAHQLKKYKVATPKSNVNNYRIKKVKKKLT